MEQDFLVMVKEGIGKELNSFKEGVDASRNIEVLLHDVGIFIEVLNEIYESLDRISEGISILKAEKKHYSQK